jgi:hypothetical protein
MGNTSGIRIARVTAFAGLLVLASLLVLWLSSRSPPAPMASRWLALPSNSWDVGDPQARLLFRWAESMPNTQGVLRGGYAGSLQYTCGEPGQPEEHYLALISTDWRDSLGKQYRLDFVPRPQGTVDVTIIEVALGEGATIPRVRHLLMARAALTQIQRAWSGEAIWSAQPGSLGCMDTGEAYFEACVDGRFHVSSRQCGGEARAALLKAFRSSLPLR